MRGRGRAEALNVWLGGRASSSDAVSRLPVAISAQATNVAPPVTPPHCPWRSGPCTGLGAVASPQGHGAWVGPERRCVRFIPGTDRVRLLVYTDYVYSRDVDGTVSAERAFARFLDGLAGHMDVAVIGRLRPEAGRSHYVLSAISAFVALPHYASLARPLSALVAMARSLRIFWRALEDIDAVWVLGPTPLTLAFALLARARRRPAFLGVRQDLPRYVRSRHPGRALLHHVADALEAANVRLARRCPAIVVGHDLAERYRGAPRLLELSVSLIGAKDIVSAQDVAQRSYAGELRILSVGRLETEKNPLLLAEVLNLLRGRDPRYRLVICGEGPLEGALRARLAELQLDRSVELLGYVPLHAGLLEIYRSSHVFLHVSWTEGLPQVLFEAFASGLPVVATNVGGVAAASGGCAVLVAPGDAPAAARAVAAIIADQISRNGLVDAGRRLATGHTVEAEIGRLAAFISSGGELPLR